MEKIAFAALEVGERFYCPFIEEWFVKEDGEGAKLAEPCLPWTTETVFWFFPTEEVER